MRFVNNILYLTISDCVECGMNARTIIDAKDKGTKCWEIIDDPADKRKVLVGYEAMKPVYQKLVNERYGNPYNHVARMPILDMVINDWKANEYYKGYRYSLTQGDGALTMLGIDAVNKYTRCVGWLNMLRDLDRKMVKKDLGLGITDFYEHVAELMTIEKERGKMKGYVGLDVLPADFPSSYQRLMARVGAYTQTTTNEGAEAAYRLQIDPAYGNKNAAKIGKVSAGAGSVTTPAGAEPQHPLLNQGGELPSKREIASPKGLAMTGVLTTNETITVEKSAEITPNSANKVGGFDLDLYNKQMAVIRAIAAKYNNFDAGQVAEMVNVLFEANGWHAVSVSTIRKIMSENVHVLTAGRKGKRAHKSTIAMQVKRRVTEIPCVYWTLDGWTVELTYQERPHHDKKDTRTEYKRLVVVVVLDAWQKYPIGYAIGERETPELIKEANRNALLHVKELFGQVYRPVQVQSDNYQIKNLTPFYQAMAHLHTPAAVGNAKAKIVEPYFMYLNKNYCQKMPNWSGFNLNSSKHNQVNTEMLNKVKHTFPDKKGVIAQIEYIMAQERSSKQAAYVAKWSDMPEDRKYSLNVKEWLEVFGVAIGKTNRITGEGLVKQIDGVKYVYDSFEREFRNNMHLDWQLLAEPADLSKVLAVSPDNKMRIVLEQKRVLPMDVMSTTDEDRAYRTRIDAYNNELEVEITEMYGRDADTIREVVRNTPFDLSDDSELALKVMFTEKGQQKELLQDAKGLKAVDSRQVAGGSGSARASNDREAAEEWEARQAARLDSIIDFSLFTA